MTKLKTTVTIESQEMSRSEMAETFETAMREMAAEGVRVSQGMFEAIEE